MKHLMISIIFVLYMVSLPAESLAEIRVWKGKNGSTVEAEFISSDEKNVVLKNTNGRTITVPIARLSAGDQQYIKTKSQAADRVAPVKNRFYALKIEFVSEAGKASLDILAPWKDEVVVVEKKCPIYDEWQKKRRELGQPPRTDVTITDWGIEWKNNSSSYEDEIYAPLTLEYIIYIPSIIQDDFRFSLEKSTSGVVSAEIFSLDTNTGKTKRIRTFKNSGDEGKEFKITFNTIRSKCVEFTFDPTE